MRWRFLDAVTQFEPWHSAAGRKAISLEEYSLLDPLGREGEYPESLVLESAVELVRWLVMKSSSFERTCAVEEVQGFAILYHAGPGDVLEFEAKDARRESDRLTMACEVRRHRAPAARGEITVALFPLAGALDPEIAAAAWKELYAPA